MQIIHATSAPTMDNPHGVKAAQIYSSEHALAVHLTLEPGEALKPHITPVDVFFYVLEGTGVVEIGDETQQVQVDAVIESPAGIKHCWYNKSEQPLRVLVVKVPRPTQQTRLL